MLDVYFERGKKKDFVVRQMACLLASTAQSIVILWALWIHSKMKVIQWIKLGLNKMHHKAAFTMTYSF